MGTTEGKSTEKHNKNNDNTHKTKPKGGGKKQSIQMSYRRKLKRIMVKAGGREEGGGVNDVWVWMCICRSGSCRGLMERKKEKEREKESRKEQRNAVFLSFAFE